MGHRHPEVRGIHRVEREASDDRAPVRAEVSLREGPGFNGAEDPRGLPVLSLRSISDDLLAPPGRARAMPRVEDLFWATGGMLRHGRSRGALVPGTVEVRKDTTAIRPLPPRGEGISVQPPGNFFPRMAGLPEPFRGVAMAGNRVLRPSEEVLLLRGPGLGIRPAALETSRDLLGSTFALERGLDGTRTAEIPVPRDSRARRIGRREGPGACSKSRTGGRGR